MQTLVRRLENGGVLACTGISRTTQPFFAALVHHIFPQRPIVVVTEGLKTQESFQQDLATWLEKVWDALSEQDQAKRDGLLKEANSVLERQRDQTEAQ